MQILNRRPRRRANARFLTANSRGFTLIEVVIALAVAAIGLAAVTAAVSQMIDAASSMRQRTYASWIAQNKITEMRLASVAPEVSSSSGEVEFASLDWSWRATVSETGIESLYRVDVEVGLAGADTSARTVTGFIGDPIVPGSSNLAWSSGSQATGEDI